jgi:uncharacterized RDD family membrane protein YckC
MVEAKLLFHCVCGEDLPLAGDREIVCSRCHRHHHPQAMKPSMVETVVLGGNGGKRAAGPPPSAGSPTLVGQTFDHFRILDHLGQGGVGTVYRAVDTSLERYVALKVLNEEGDPEALEAFVHEARAQARLNHPGIATIYYVGRRGETPYFAMEYVPGESLDVRLDRGPLPAGEVIRIGIQAVRALREASAQGITHRDIKPGNFILSRSGTLKLTDFGLSKTERGGLELTGRHCITGTPNYIAPEQARGETTDLRTDIYSLGAMLYHLAYGKPPFDGENFMGVIAKHLASPLEFPREPPADIPAGFSALIGGMMAKDPAERFQDYDALEKALGELLPELLVVASVVRRAVATLLEVVGLVLLVALATGTFSMVLQLVFHEMGRNAAVFAATRDSAMGLGLLALFVSQLLRGRTQGKEFARLKIASIRGGRPGRLYLGARWLFQWLPFLAFLLWSVLPKGMGRMDFLGLVLAFWLADHLWALTNRRRRTLHDLATGTWVLEDTRGPDPA